MSYGPPYIAARLELQQKAASVWQLLVSLFVCKSILWCKAASQQQLSPAAVQPPHRLSRVGRGRKGRAAQPGQEQPARRGGWLCRQQELRCLGLVGDLCGADYHSKFSSAVFTWGHRYFGMQQVRQGEAGCDPQAFAQTPSLCWGQEGTG